MADTTEVDTTDLAARPAPEVHVNDIILPNQTCYDGLYNVDG